jgi:hypothetical protein
VMVGTGHGVGRFRHGGEAGVLTVSGGPSC